MRADVLRRGGAAAHVAGSQIALAASNYVVLAIAARHLEPAGFAAVSAYYLLINTVGRGLFAAVELETTRAVAAGSRGAALRHTGVLLVGALVLLGLATPLLTAVLPGAAAIALLAVGAATMAASYLIRGPLAGLQRYGRYAATFWIEAGVGLVAAVVLMAVDERATTAWIAVLALAPAVAPLLLGGRASDRGGRRGRDADRDEADRDDALGGAREGNAGGRSADGRSADGRSAGGLSGVAAGARSADATSVRPVLWSAALLLAGQGVWNLAPVLATARLADAPALAAGFTTAVVIVRAPVLLFPTIQAMLLPRLAAGATRTPRLLVGGIAGAGLVWVVLAAVAVPWVATLVFATTAPPPAWVLAVLALSTVLGALAQVAQAQLVAARRTHAAALAWVTGLVVLLVVGLIARPPIEAAAFGQLAAALVVLGGLVPARRSS